MSKRSSPDAATFNGDKHGELYSPEYAVHINTEDKEKQQTAEEQKEDKGQGDLYTPKSAIHISASQQKKQDSNKQQPRVKKADGESRKRNDGDIKNGTESMRKPSSKL